MNKWTLESNDRTSGQDRVGIDLTLELEEKFPEKVTPLL